MSATTATAAKVGSSIAHAVDGVVLDRRSQLGRIGAQLASSYDSSAPGALPDYAAHELIETLLCGLRAAIHEPVRPIGLADSGSWNVFQLSKGEFLTELAAREPSDAAALKTAWDSGWVHVPLHEVLQRGEESTRHKPLWLRAYPDELQEVAEAYLCQSSLRSDELEWHLVAALLFAECLSLAQQLASQNKIFGVTFAEVLQGTEAKGAWKRDAKGALLALTRVSVTFAVKLAVLLAAATFLADGDKLVFALVLLAGVVVWQLKPERDTVEEQQRIKTVRLLADMGAAANQTRHFRFNARLLRHLLYGLEARGAVFSPSIYHILDMRAARAPGN